ncbi:MAG: metal-dependent hydrolase [Halobacteriales archaeon]|nr:metal-dependent hydrolase [Halobacteriales archaeon]
MPSTVVHVGFAVLIATALLGAQFDRRTLLVVAVFTVLPDLDTFLGFVWTGAHRAALHNLVVPLAVFGLLYWDVRLRDESYVLARYGARGYRIATIAVLGGWLVAGVLLDAVHNGANLLFPFHDEFIDLSGHLFLSNERGVVQTFVSFDGFALGEEHSRGTTQDTHYYTGVDPGPDAPEDVERIFPVFDNAELALLSLTGYVAAALRLREGRDE